MSSSDFIKTVAWRYFRFNRSGERLISVISTISIIGVAIGCFAMVVTLSVLNGFRAKVTALTVQFEAAVKAEEFPMHRDTVSNLQRWARTQPDIRFTVPLIERKAMVAGDDATEITFIKALQLDSLHYPVASQVIGGTFDLGDATHPKVVLGYGLLDKLGAQVGDTVAIISPLEVTGPFYTPPVIKAEVSGVFRADIFQYDQLYAFTNIAAGQELFRLRDEYTGVEVYTTDFQQADHVANTIRQNPRFQALHTTTWFQRHQTLYSAMRLEKWGSFIVLTLIILVATFNLISSLVMLVLEKIRDIGILKTLGATDQSVRQIFIRQGLYVGTIGTTIGVSLGVMLVLIQQFTGLITLPSVYFIRVVPVRLLPLDIVAITVVSVVLSILSAMYPAKQAAGLRPIEAISYDH